MQNVCKLAEQIISQKNLENVEQFIGLCSHLSFEINDVTKINCCEKFILRYISISTHFLIKFKLLAPKGF
jgi:hypothetical protein